LELDLQDYFTCFANLTGLPALSLPCGATPEGLPLGMQLIGPAESEGLVMQAAYAYEQSTEWHKRHPIV
jgi:aspartyl-tRNA(Asn)/glutamyl-tRNA(Gln) amidotransferase subunit A